MKKFRKNIIFLIAICIIVLFFVLKDDFNGITKLLINANKMYILIAILFMLISDMLKGISISSLVRASNFKYKNKNYFFYKKNKNKPIAVYYKNKNFVLVKD